MSEFTPGAHQEEPDIIDLGPEDYQVLPGSDYHRGRFANSYIDDETGARVYELTDAGAEAFDKIAGAVGTTIDIVTALHEAIPKEIEAWKARLAEEMTPEMREYRIRQLTSEIEGIAQRLPNLSRTELAGAVTTFLAPFISVGMTHLNTEGINAAELPHVPDNQPQIHLNRSQLRQLRQGVDLETPLPPIAGGGMGPDDEPTPTAIGTTNPEATVEATEAAEPKAVEVHYAHLPLVMRNGEVELNPTAITPPTETPSPTATPIVIGSATPGATATVTLSPTATAIPPTETPSPTATPERVDLGELVGVSMIGSGYDVINRGYHRNFLIRNANNEFNTIAGTAVNTSDNNVFGARIHVSPLPAGPDTGQYVRGLVGEPAQIALGLPRRIGSMEESMQRAYMHFDSATGKWMYTELDTDSLTMRTEEFSDSKDGSEDQNPAAQISYVRTNDTTTTVTIIDDNGNRQTRDISHPNVPGNFFLETVAPPNETGIRVNTVEQLIKPRAAERRGVPENRTRDKLDERGLVLGYAAKNSGINTKWTAMDKMFQDPTVMRDILEGEINALLPLADGTYIPVDDMGEEPPKTSDIEAFLRVTEQHNLRTFVGVGNSSMVTTHEDGPLSSGYSWYPDLFRDLRNDANWRGIRTAEKTLIEDAWERWGDVDGLSGLIVAGPSTGNRAGEKYEENPHGMAWQRDGKREPFVPALIDYTERRNFHNGSIAIEDRNVIFGDEKDGFAEERKGNFAAAINDLPDMDGDVQLDIIVVEKITPAQAYELADPYSTLSLELQAFLELATGKGRVNLVIEPDIGGESDPQELAVDIAIPFLDRLSPKVSVFNMRVDGTDLNGSPRYREAVQNALIRNE